MAYVTSSHALNTNLSPVSWFLNLRATVVARIAKASEYNRIITELSSLSDRELTDIGIARSDIHDIAKKHVNVQ
jgi:uncharacterized protein YjiS (DUF1127 family)